MYSRLIVPLCGALLVLSLMTCPDTGRAQDPVTFDVEIPVADTGKQARQAAFRAALDQVLLANPELVAGAPGGRQEAALERADRFVQQYRYLRPGDTIAADAGDVPRTELGLWVRFDGIALRRALAVQDAAGSSPGVAGAQFAEVRAGKEVLVWVGVEREAQRFILGGDDGGGALRGQLLAAAREAGVTALFPLLDLEDRSRVAFRDLWGGYIDRVVAASRRYDVETVLLGRVYLDAGQWSADWILREQDEDEQWALRNQSLDAIFSAAMARAGARVTADRPPLQPLAIPDNQVRLFVEGIESLSDYARVTEYLNGLDPVRTAQVVEVGDTRMEFSLELEGDPSGLDAAIAMDAVLERMDGTADRRYRLRQ